MTRFCLCIMALTVMSTSLCGQVSPEEALRQLQQAEAASEDPANLKSKNERLKQEAHKLRQQIETLQKQIADLRAVILQAGDPTGQAVASGDEQPIEGPRTVRVLESLRELTSMIPESALPKPEDRNDSTAYGIIHRDLVNQHLDAILQQQHLRLTGTFTIMHTPTTVRGVRDTYRVVLIPPDLDYDYNGHNRLDTYRAEPCDTCIDTVAGYITGEQKISWHRMRSGDRVTIEADITEINAERFLKSLRQRTKGNFAVAVDLNVQLNNITLLKHEKKEP